MEVGGWIVSTVGRPLVDPEHVGRVRAEEPVQAGQGLDEHHGQAFAQLLAGRREIGDVRSGGDQQLVRPRGRVRHGGLPSGLAGDEQVAGGFRAEAAGGRREFGGRDGRDRAKGHDLAVRMLDGGADQPAAVLEDEHVADVMACPERRRTRRPQLDHPGRPFLAQDRERSIVIRAVQDDLVTPAGQGGPAIRDVPYVVRPGRLEAARAERARSFREVGTLLPPGGDDDMAARQRVDAQLSIAHEAQPYAATRNRRGGRRPRFRGNAGRVLFQAA